MKLQFSQKKDPKVHYLFMEGDLIGDEAGPRLAEMVSDSVEEGIKILVIDLEKVRYISSSGLGLLITLLTKMRNAGGELYLTAPSEHVKKLLIITKLNGIFKVFDSVDELTSHL
ncbi:MAG: STAS domain-containing protein [Algoriphagus sp.]|jgi:anti-sigma B factor antagonist|nr:STAS domain-containing protein [Algoriphagus sp.]MCE2779862.1 STAS domain-containing protein [Algoriphagus sp.]